MQEIYSKKISLLSNFKSKFYLNQVWFIQLKKEKINKLLSSHWYLNTAQNSGSHCYHYLKTTETWYSDMKISIERDLMWLNVISNDRAWKSCSRWKSASSDKFKYGKERCRGVSLVNVYHLGLPYLTLRFTLVYVQGFFTMSVYQDDTETLKLSELTAKWGQGDAHDVAILS